MKALQPLAPPPVDGRARPLGRFGVAFGPRTFVFLIAGLAWLIPAFADGRFVGAMLAWDALVLAAWTIDVMRLPAPARLSVRRMCLSTPVLAVESGVELTLTNDSRTAISARVIDAVPHQLRAAPPDLVLRAEPGSAARARYTIAPATRGETRVGAVYVRYQSPLRLAERWSIVDLAQTIVAYPNLIDARRQSMYLIRSRQIELEKRSSRVRGAGRAFESLREYRDGDEFRDICWTASARRGKPVTRLYEIERSQTVWVLLDCGRLMRARVARLSKLDHAVNAALALSQVALDSGDRVGLLTYGRRDVRRLPAAAGRRHFRHVVDHLTAAREDEWEADHLLAASRVLTDQKRRSLIVWLTDLAETAMTPEVVRAASHLMRRHVVLFIVMGEPDLQELARRTPTDAREMYEAAAAQELLHRREALLARLREGGALALETTAGALSLALVNAYLDVKQRSRL